MCCCDCNNNMDKYAALQQVIDELPDVQRTVFQLRYYEEMKYSEISDILGTEDAGRMIRCGENVISIVISMIICFLLFITVSSALMLLICRQ